MSEQDNKLPSGFLISGICMGSETVVDGQYTNNNVYIKTGERPNEVGEQISQIETISVYGDNLQVIMNNANALKGKHVVMSISRRPAARIHRDVYMRNSIVRDSQLKMVS